MKSKMLPEAEEWIQLWWHDKLTLTFTVKCWLNSCASIKAASQSTSANDWLPVRLREGQQETIDESNLKRSGLRFQLQHLPSEPAVRRRHFRSFDAITRIVENNSRVYVGMHHKNHGHHFVGGHMRDGGESSFRRRDGPYEVPTCQSYLCRLYPGNDHFSFNSSRHNRVAQWQDTKSALLASSCIAEDWADIPFR